MRGSRSSPETVAARLSEDIARLGSGNLLGLFQLGTLPADLTPYRQRTDELRRRLESTTDPLRELGVLRLKLEELLDDLRSIGAAEDELGPLAKLLAELAAFISEHDNPAWDAQIGQDAATGKLDFLFEEAERERADGKLRDWPKGE